MKKQTAIELAGGTQKQLAELLEITSGAITQWGENVPKERVWQLHMLRPEWFPPKPAERVSSTVAS